MKEIILDSNGKINLGLNVINKRNDGYHNLITVMQEIDLKDNIIIKRTDKEGIKISSNNKYMPKGKENLVYQAWDILRKYKDGNDGVSIYIEKNIPMGAGLAGGSSNAAAVLKGLNKLWSLGFSLKELEQFGAKLGADVPFCIRGGTVLAKGIGNKFYEINSFKNKHILLINPNIHMSTKEVYKKLVLKDVDENRLDDLIVHINEGRDKLVGESLYNNLEDVVFQEENKIKELKKELLDEGALGSLMSGSGSTVFGIFENEEALNRAYERFNGKYDEYFITRCKTI